MIQVAYDLNLEQNQKLVMTPRLYQAIAVLQLSAMELNAYIEQQLEENPLLELGDDCSDISLNEADGSGEQEVEGSQREICEFNWEDYFVQQYYEAKDSFSFPLDRKQSQFDYDFTRVMSSNVTLSEYLMSQLNLCLCCDEDKMIGEYLIGNIDDSGYLRISIEEVQERLQVDGYKVDRMLHLLQGFDPAGVAARDLQECLLIQVKRAQITDEVIIKLINYHLTDLAKGRLVRIAHQLGVSIQEVQQASDSIKTLDPKPGRNFSGVNSACYIIPDVVVEKVGNDYIVLVDDVIFPRIIVNTVYHSVLNKNKNVDSDTRRFVENKLNAAVWLIRSIEQRRLTLYKVACCLVDLQRDFLDRGINHLKTLNLKKVADIIGMHVSTVSRATSNKYIQTPRGIFEMKYFFSNGLDNKEGNKISTESIKNILQEIIADENSMYPLNDQKIADALGERGVKISRRTVAKYRDDLGIPSIQKRKRY